MEFDSVGFDILVLPQCGIQHAVRWANSLDPLEKEDRVT